MVVEQRKGDTTYFPHTDQLPILASAITREFQAGLSNYIVKTDVRGDDFRKVLLHEACYEFCHFKNAARQDKVNLFWLTNPDKLTDVAIAQKVTRTSKHGRMHRFRFYLGGKYFQEVYMNGKRMVFTQHAVERFSQRVPCIKGESLTQFLITFYKTLPCHMRVGSGSGLVYLSNNSMVAFPFEETADEIIFKTCLSPNEISNLAENRNSRLYLVHYGKECRCSLLSVICLSSIRLHPSGVRRSEGERSEPSAAEPQRGEAAPRAKNWSRAGHVGFLLGCQQTHPTSNRT